MSELLTLEVPAEGAPGLELSDDLREFAAATSLEQLLPLAKEVLADLSFPTARAWVRTGKPAVGFFPVYTPQEIAHAMGFLPVTLEGGGEFLDISHADAALGSFLCSISKSTLELALTDRLAPFSAFVFPYICDVSRNLEGIVARALPGRATHMLHLPQNFGSPATVPFLVAEYRRMAARLEAAGGRPLTPESLARSIELFNEHRALLAELRRFKVERPQDLPIGEYYLLRRIGTVLPRELHVMMLRRALAELGRRQRPVRDAIRVAVVGSFCEQPTLDLLELLEEVGCYVVGDELQMLGEWHPPIAPSGDPLTALARAYVESPIDLGIRAAPSTKAAAILDRVDRTRAQGVIFLTAKFCEPALEDVVLYRRGLDARKLPYLHLEFEEKSTAYEQSRLQLETFVESILFN